MFPSFNCQPECLVCFDALASCSFVSFAHQRLLHPFLNLLPDTCISLRNGHEPNHSMKEYRSVMVVESTVFLIFRLVVNLTSLRHSSLENRSRDFVKKTVMPLGDDPLIVVSVRGIRKSKCS